jgi:molecular chaperone DnaK (HSP70)
MLLGRVAGSVREITPYPLGIGAFPPRGMPDDDTKMFSVIVNRHTPIPTPPSGARDCLTQTYVTRFPYQTQMSIEVLQYRGERECASTDPRMHITADECEVLGAWTLTGIKPREQSFVDVSFQIDRDGILNVTACEQGTRNILRQQIDRW